MRSAPSTNTHWILVAAIEEDLNIEDKENVCFDAALVLEYKDEDNEESLSHRHTLETSKYQSTHKQNHNLICKPRS